MNKERRSIFASSNLLNIKRKLGLLSSPKIIPFIGFANHVSVFISGLVVEENGLSRPAEGQSRWQNIKAMLKRYTGNELENIHVKVSYADMIRTVKTDKYGIFRVDFQLNNKTAPGNTWQIFEVEIEQAVKSFPGSKAQGEIMQVIGNPQFGIISDVDDTILISHATQKLMKLRLMFFNNAHTRMPFEGVSAFYRALQEGTDGTYNPIFYVSNSEWNLYDLLYEFIEFHRIPKGPLLLREMAIRVLRPWRIREVNRNHKTESIRKILDTYPQMKFILIGDSGQRDPLVYSSITKQNPGRVLAIYIRDAGIDENLPEVKEISRSLMNDTKTEMVIVKDSEAAAWHALDRGFISPGRIQLIVQDKLEDSRKKDSPSETLV